MGRIALTCLNLGAEGWLDWKHQRCHWPRLAVTTEKLVISEFVKFFKEKTRSDPRRKVTSVFREKQSLFANSSNKK